MNPMIAAQVNHRKGYGRVRPYSKKDSCREGMIYFSFITASKEANSITRCTEGNKQRERGDRIIVFGLMSLMYYQMRRSDFACYFTNSIRRLRASMVGG